MPRRDPADPSQAAKISKLSVNSKVSLVPHSTGGTYLWMSPELLDPERFGFDKDDRRPTKQADCYALGMVVYEVRRHLIAV